jgi:hypothetical protein
VRRGNVEEKKPSIRSFILFISHFSLYAPFQIQPGSTKKPKKKCGEKVSDDQIQVGALEREWMVVVAPEAHVLVWRDYQYRLMLVSNAIFFKALAPFLKSNLLPHRGEKVNGLDSRPARGRLWCGAQFLI